ncbi:MAG: hypothetical protein ACM3ML_16640 [Micromonosporaceae bacterium]
MGAATAGARNSRVSWVWRWLVFAGGIAAWEAFTRWKQSPFFPPPSAIVTRMHQLWFSPPAAHLFLTRDPAGNVLPSVGRILAGMVIATALGAPIGVAVGRSAAVRGYLDPFRISRGPFLLLPWPLSSLSSSSLEPRWNSPRSSSGRSGHCFSTPRTALLLMVFAGLVGTSNGLGYELTNASSFAT